MERDEVIDLLTVIAGYDRRKAGEVDVTTWGDAVSRHPWIDYRVAVEAVKRHFASSTEYLMPAHVINQARNIRYDIERAKAKRRALEPPAPKPINPHSFRARNPEEWDRLYQQGKQEHEADLRYRDII